MDEAEGILKAEVREGNINGPQVGTARVPKHIPPLSDELKRWLHDVAEEILEEVEEETHTPLLFHLF